MSKNRAAAIIYLVVGFYGFILSIMFPMGKWNEPGPGVFPVSLSLLLILSGCYWLIFGKAKEEQARIRWAEIAPKLVTPIKILSITLGFVLTMETLGFLPGLLIYLFILLFWVSRYRVWISAVISIFMGVGSWYFFVKVLAIQLPMGLFPIYF
jgi:putative tricarboxylic transport membrane protein